MYEKTPAFFPTICCIYDPSSYKTDRPAIQVEFDKDNPEMFEKDI